MPFKRGDLVFYKTTYQTLIGVITQDYNPTRERYVYAAFWMGVHGHLTTGNCYPEVIEKIGSISDLGLTF